MKKNIHGLHKDQKPKKVTGDYLQQINPHAGGIDVGSKSHHVAIRTATGEISTLEFGAFTADLYTLAKWLKENKVTTVAMESTGIYWIPLYDVLEESGLEVKLVDARHVKNVTGRKTDVTDCQWLQQLHACGLLQGAFRPEEKIRPLRAYSRQRSMLIASVTTHIQHMQKALFQMNLQLSNVLSDITGATGIQIIRAIVLGERDPKKLAQLRHPRCQNSEEVIEKSLTGHWRQEHLFSLQQALEGYDFCQQQIMECDKKLEQAIQKLNDGNPTAMEGPQSQPKKEPRSHKTPGGNALYFDVTAYLKSITSVDLTKIPGISGNTALKLIGEIGLDITRWKSAAHFASWLGLSPENKVSGGKRLSSRTKPTANPAAQAFRVAASTLHRSKCAMGAFLRRLKARIGPMKAITATARKLAVIVYSMLKNGTEFVEAGLVYYETKYKERLIKGLTKSAAKLGFLLVPQAEFLNQPTPIET